MNNSTLSDLANILVRGRNGDGGWGYYPGKSSRLEPTAWAALALHDTISDAADALRNWPSADGLLLERAAGGTPNFAFHGLALLTMQACGVEHEAANAKLVDGLQRVKGIKLQSYPNSRQDNTLQAWSWFPDTFSWVEPTAWCTLSLKKWAKTTGARLDAARLEDAERMLINRSCQVGGWNYGNPDAMGRELRPYVPTTAIALLAMQDRRTDPVIGRSLDYLERYATSERTGTALALALVALRTCGRPSSGVRAALIEQLPVTMDLGNHMAIALAAYALGSEQANHAFTL
jgi:hypothetical protein